ncbi:hypothetical protein ES703_00070 [subsurface metagenome]
MSTADTIFRIAIADPYVKFSWGYLSERERASTREVHEASGVDNWWPIKAGLDTLKQMKLVEERDEVWSLTEFGKRVRDVQAATRELRVV